MSVALLGALCLVALQEPPSPAGTEDAAGAVIDGEATIGYRLRDVSGSQAQYDQDVNLDQGFFLRSARLRASGLREGPVESLELSAEGAGDPFASYRLDALGGPWRTRGRYDHERYVGNAQEDQHPFDIDRQRGSLDLDYRPAGSSTRSFFGFDLVKRDGLFLGSRSVEPDFVSGFPVLRDETTRAVRGGFASEAGGWTLDTRLGLETLSSSDRLDFDLPSPSFPGNTVSEDFSADTHGTGQEGKLKLARALGRGARLALDFGWITLGRQGDEASTENGFFFDPSLPFVRTTQGVLDLSGREFEGGVQLSFPVSSGSELELSWSRRHQRSDGQLARSVVVDDLSGDPPIAESIVDLSTRDSTLDRFELEATSELGAATHLDLSLNWGQEELNVRDSVGDITVRSFDGSLREFGVEADATFELHPGLALDLGLGHQVRPVETPDAGVGFGFDDDRESFALARCRVNGAQRSLAAEVRLEHRASDPLTSEGDVGRYGLTYAGHLAEHTRFDLLASFATHDLESPTTFLFFDPVSGAEVVPGVASFHGHELVLGGGIEHELGELHPRLSWSLALGSGDSEFDYRSATADLPWELDTGFEVGASLIALDFDGSGVLDASDYRALVLELYLRRRFGPHPL